MGAYILKRILLMIPTLLGIMLVTFAVIQFAPGGPVERVIAKIQGTDVDATARVGGTGTGESGGGQDATVKLWDLAAAAGQDPLRRTIKTLLCCCRPKCMRLTVAPA